MNDLTLQILLNLSQGSFERSIGNFHNAHHFLHEAEKLALSGGSKYDESLCHLETGVLALREGKTRLVEEKFDQAYQFFNQEGYEGDRFRAEFYLKLSSLNPGNQDEQVAKFSDWLDLPRSEEKKSSLTSDGK